MHPDEKTAEVTDDSKKDKENKQSDKIYEEKSESDDKNKKQAKTPEFAPAGKEEPSADQTSSAQNDDAEYEDNNKKWEEKYNSLK